MKRCPRCDRTHPETEPRCPYCYYVEEPPAQTAAHIDYLLGEIPQWVARAWVDREKADLLANVYSHRRDSLRPPAAPAAPLVARHPPLAVNRPDDLPVRPARRAHPLAAFLEERNISYWHVVGAALLVAGLSGLIRFTWNTVGKDGVFALLFVVTAGFFWLGRTLSAQGHRTPAG